MTHCSQIAFEAAFCGPVGWSSEVMRQYVRRLKLTQDAADSWLLQFAMRNMVRLTVLLRRAHGRRAGRSTLHAQLTAWTTLAQKTQAVMVEPTVATDTRNRLRSSWRTLLSIQIRHGLRTLARRTAWEVAANTWGYYRATAFL